MKSIVVQATECIFDKSQAEEVKRMQKNKVSKLGENLAAFV